ncbi:alpha-N-acetylgalactosaminide alpha-2,6-sialyltransferase 5 [Tachysurus ichikawai]
MLETLQQNEDSDGKRHGAAVFLAITMCTSLFLIYNVNTNNNNNNSDSRSGSSPAMSTQNPHKAPPLPPLQGYISIIDHSSCFFSPDPKPAQKILPGDEKWQRVSGEVLKPQMALQFDQHLVINGDLLHRCSAGGLLQQSD